MMMRSLGGGGGGGSSSGGCGVSGGGGGDGTTRCQECGNQAKRDCVYIRCRTCCNNKGFHCQTHIKSTWVPAYRRNQTQTQTQTRIQTHHRYHHHDNEKLPVQEQHHQYPQLQGLLENIHNPKRLREISTSSGLEEGDFPAEVRIPATFRCVRVSSVDDPADQFAYQTSVNIGGHVFKGILYDQGVDDRSYMGVGESSNSQQQPHQSNAVGALIAHHLNVNTTRSSSASTSNVDVLPSPRFPFSFNAFMSGTQFLSNPRP